VKFGVIRFPGSNCDQDAYFTIKDVLGQPVEYLWHQDTALHGVDCVVIPGGFSYGDYLRCGAIARFSPVMGAVQDFASRGGFVLGICNGFQVLCEAGLLPGALVRNEGQRFVCRHVSVRVENNSSPFTNRMRTGSLLNIPVAHGEGQYVCGNETLMELQSAGRVLFRYDSAANPNGSTEDIAGIANAEFNVLGMMPHPERAADQALGSADGRLIFDSLLSYQR
jgi:phosphoribosylformylglycinamidine synthase I